MNAPAASDLLADTSPWADAALAAALFAVDPAGTAGVWLRALAGPVRDRWLRLLRELLPASDAVRRVPIHISDDRLLGGLDLSATLRAGRPVAQRGILAEADGGVVLLAMAERLSAGMGARLSRVLDVGEIALERDGIGQAIPARIGMVALDEGMAVEERPCSGLTDRLAFHLDLADIANGDLDCPLQDASDIVAARSRLSAVTAGFDMLETFCGTAQALGIASIRAPLLALRVARAAAALAGRAEVNLQDAATAARLVFARRATIVLRQNDADEGEAPEQPPQEVEPPPDSKPKPDEEPAESSDGGRSMTDMVLAAVQAVLPADLLSQLQLANGGPPRAQTSGRAGQVKHSQSHGRPIGTRRGEPRAGARLHIIETLKAAAPWQTLRRREADAHKPSGGPRHIQVRRDDFRIVRFKQRIGTTTIFAVDVSGSAALARLAETKGAVELLLADCYVRRDKVALVAFRGQGAELLLAPTNSLVRAKRSLAGLPGGGGTPLAAGIDAAGALADAVRRSGQTPVIALMTDGRANIARDGSVGRAKAEEDAMQASRRLMAAGFTALLVDTSPRPSPGAQRLAAEMHARYLPLPYADATRISAAIRVAGAASAP